jgi:hypothetical protein
MRIKRVNWMRSGGVGVYKRRLEIRDLETMEL